MTEHPDGMTDHGGKGQSKDRLLPDRIPAAEQGLPESRRILGQRYTLVQTHVLVQPGALVQGDLFPPLAHPGGSGLPQAPFCLFLGCSPVKAALSP